MYVQDIPLFPPTETLKKKKQHICSYLSTYIKLQTAETAPLQFVYFYCIYWLKFVSYKRKKNVCLYTSQGFFLFLSIFFHYSFLYCIWHVSNKPCLYFLGFKFPQYFIHSFAAPSLSVMLFTHLISYTCL